MLLGTGTAPARPARQLQGCSASDTSLMNIFLFINQQALNLLLSNSSLSHHLVSRCNGQVKTCASYLELVWGFFFFFVCSPSRATAPSPPRPRATLGNAGRSGHQGPAAPKERAPGEAEACIGCCAWPLEMLKDDDHPELPAMPRGAGKLQTTA